MVHFFFWLTYERFKTRSNRWKFQLVLAFFIRTEVFFVAFFIQPGLSYPSECNASYFIVGTLCSVKTQPLSQKLIVDQCSYSWGGLWKQTLLIKTAAFSFELHCEVLFRFYNSHLVTSSPKPHQQVCTSLIKAGWQCFLCYIFFSSAELKRESTDTKHVLDDCLCSEGQNRVNSTYSQMSLVVLPPAIMCMCSRTVQ